MRAVNNAVVDGLPGPLPAGEYLLWKGAPEWRPLARRAFHTGTVAVYFGILLVWRLGLTLSSDAPLRSAAVPLALMTLLFAVGLGILYLLAWLTARTTRYIITSRRVVVRSGIVLGITFNFPFRQIESAGIDLHRDATGDIAITLDHATRIAWLHLWPNVRPWLISRPAPMLRCVVEAPRVAKILSQALAAAMRAEARIASTPPPGTEPMPSPRYLAMLEH